MQVSRGDLIRQLRRQYNLTQTELGGDRFSKSYVSAVERNKIIPSAQALRYFAEQLHKPEEYFSNPLQRPENMHQLSRLDTPTPDGAGHNGSGFQSEEPRLLDILLENPELSNMTPHYQFHALTPELIAQLSPLKQARYHFLMGLTAQDEQNLVGALQEFEQALGLASKELHPGILNEIGRNYYLTHQYSMAKGFHLRALGELRQQYEQRDGASDALDNLHFKIEFNCGEDFQALGQYREASQHYEVARRFLSPAHDMKTAALLYRGLGHCIHGAIDELAFSKHATSAEEGIEREYQRATSFLLQSRTLYQVGGDWLAEVQTRLLQARILLDFSIRCQQVAREAKKNPVLVLPKCSSLLDEAEEQCHQVLLALREVGSKTLVAPGNLDAIVYQALARLIQVFVQRATLARVSGSADVATQQRIIACYLCQEVLRAFPQSELPWDLIDKAATVKLGAEMQQSVSEMELFQAPPEEEEDYRSPVSHVETYFVASELAEELAHMVTDADLISEWHERANRWLQVALANAMLVVQSGARDPGYLAYFYRRCFTLLENRMETLSGSDEETLRALVAILKKGISQLPALAR